MKRKLLSLLVLLMTAATGAWAQGYKVTFSGFSMNDMNTTVYVASLPKTFTNIAGWDLSPYSVFGCYDGTFVSTEDQGKVSAGIDDPYNNMHITVHDAFDGTATIEVCGEYAEWDDELEDYVPMEQHAEIKVTCASVVASGDCGDPSAHDGKDVTWTLTSGGVLTISGTGAMADYTSSTMPWYSNKEDITSVVIEGGVTSIGDYAFASCTNLATVTISASVTSIGYYAFNGCSNLATVALNSNPFIDDEAFPDGATVTMTLTSNWGGSAYWTTFYNQNYRFQAAENIQVFKVTVDGTRLTMHEVEDKITQEGSGYVLKKTGDIHFVMTRTESVTSDNVSSNLYGVAVAGGMTSDGNMYVLNNGSQGMGFYKLKSGKTLGVGKAYLYYSGSGSLAREFFLFSEATSMSEELRVKSEEFASAVVFDLQGRRVQNPTKGLYIVNGKKIFINK